MSDLDPNSQARFFYLLILGLALLSGVFWRYRGRLGQGLQHAAIWVLLFAGLMIAYGFQDELKDQLNIGAERTEPGTIAVRRNPDSHFYLTLEINGRDVRFAVDTGASEIVLTKADAARLGLQPETLDYNSPALTANGRVWTAPVRLDEVRLQGFSDRNIRAFVNGGELGQSLLGMSYLSRYRLEIDGDRMLMMR